MTATAVRIMQLEKDKKGKLTEESKEELDSFFDALSDKKTKNRIGYVSKAFGQKGQLDYQLSKLRKRAKDAGLSIYNVGKGRDAQAIIYDSKNPRSVVAANNLIKTLSKTKNMTLPRVTKETSQKVKRISEGLNKIKNKKRSISKKYPIKGNTTKKSKNKNIQELKGIKEKRTLEKKPKYFPD